VLLQFSVTPPSSETNSMAYVVSIANFLKIGWSDLKK
jgi:hypothetical protein